uniref:Uncharacterized protein n=1 Tax=Fagus sylvatica TaxID=28930 RepID=A0A2N9IPN2_FAGSY
MSSSSSPSRMSFTYASIEALDPKIRKMKQSENK